MEWKDRVPTKANRKKIIFEDTTLGTKYATVEYADEPSEIGTALNKANLLQGFNNVECVSKTYNISTPVSSSQPYNGNITVDLGYKPAGFILLGITTDQIVTFTKNDQSVIVYPQQTVTSEGSYSWLCGEHWHFSTVTNLVPFGDVGIKIKSKYEFSSFSQNSIIFSVNIEFTQAGMTKYDVNNTTHFHFLVFKKPIE